MKQTLKLLTVLALFLSLAAPVWAKGLSNVAETVHNMSSATSGWNQYYSNVEEVCVFCHTPHGGNNTGPLWNRSLPGVGSFTHYNSATLSTYLTGLSVARNIGDESLLCMSCHDGSVAVSHLINDPNSLNGAAVTNSFDSNPDREILPQFPDPGARIGGSLAAPGGTGDLSDDHPISFSYEDVYNEYQAGGSSRIGQLHSIVDAIDNGDGVRFFGATSRVECSSCHDPHVDYDFDSPTGQVEYTPFLIMPNTGSALCLACHNK